LIPVLKQPIPADFDDAIMRRKGEEFLKKHRDCEKVDFKNADHWRLATDALNKAYRGICAYTCFYIPGGGQVDHFLPKSKKEYRHLAYEWSNFRLASGKVNSIKNQATDVLDPFLIESGWFVIDFPSCQVRPADNLSSDIETKIRKTIDILKLNKHDRFVQDRCQIMQDFMNGKIKLSHMETHYPFLAAEIIRQKINSDDDQIFKSLPLSIKPPRDG